MAKSTPKGNTLIYENCIVTYIDILGFKDIVKNRFKDDPNKVISLLEVFNYQANQYIGFHHGILEYGTIIRHFSDMIVRIIRFGPDESLAEQATICYLELSNLALTQSELFKRHILIRGGMSIGSICFNDEHIFGEALNDAYICESSRAKYPIIVLNERILDKMQEYSNEPPESDENLYSLVSKYNHNCYFIDFFFQSSGAGGLQSQDLGMRYMQLYRDFIIEEMVRNKKSPEALSKILWMKDYFNYTLSRSGYSSRDIKTLLIGQLKQTKRIDPIRSFYGIDVSKFDNWF